MISRVTGMRCGILTGALALLIGCQGTPELGKGGSMVSGSAGEAGAQDAAVELAHCDRPLGLASLMEPSADALLVLQQNLNLQSPVPLLRLMMAQSNCFQVVDLQAVSDPATAAKVHYMIRPNIIFSNPGAGGYGGLAGIGSAAFGWAGALIGAAAGSIRIQEAQTVLFLNDAKTGLQKAAAEGSASVKDFGSLGGLGGWGGGLAGGGLAGGYGNTAEGKLIAAAFFDAYNKMVAQIGGGSVRAAAAEPARAAPAFEAGASYTPTIALNLRAGAGTDAAVVGSAPPGTKLVATGEREGSWWQVQNGDQTAWVSAPYLQAGP